MVQPPRHNLARRLAWPAVFAVVLAAQVAVVPYGLNDAPPAVHDAMEVYDIGWCLAHGQGYAFDWDAPDFRRAWASRNGHGYLNPLLAHHGGPHATLARPPLMPVLVAAVLRLAPDHPFRAWRVVDAVLFAAAYTLLVRATGRRFGWLPAVAVAALSAVDPLRADFVPGWWTEGLALDGVAIIASLILARRGSPSPPASPPARLPPSPLPLPPSLPPPPASVWPAVVGGGLTLGLLCLDRSVFLLLLVPFAAAIGLTATGRWRRRAGVAAGVLAVAIALQLPWWARNVAVAGQFLPVGTQGGANLPDEYSDWAVSRHGLWTDGMAMAAVWAARPPADRVRGGAAAHPDPDARRLFPGRPLYSDLLHAQTCESTATEVAVADVGQRAGLAWARSHPGQLPALFVAKIWTETQNRRPWMAFLVTAGGVGLAVTRGGPGGDRRTVALLLALAAAYAAAIGLTHAIGGRFLVPILPALYVPAAVGLGELARRLSPTARA